MSVGSATLTRFVTLKAAPQPEPARQGRVPGRDGQARAKPRIAVQGPGES
ncbi:hypothetical protein [Nonomuraea rubra]